MTRCISFVRRYRNRISWYKLTRSKFSNHFNYFFSSNYITNNHMVCWCEVICIEAYFCDQNKSIEIAKTSRFEYISFSHDWFFNLKSTTHDI